MKLKTFFFFLFIVFMNVLYSQGREGRSLSDEARDPFPERKEHKENNKEEKKTRTIVINSARTTEYKKVNGKKIEKTSIPIDVEISPSLDESTIEKEGVVEPKEKETNEKAKEENTSEEEYEKEELVIFTGNVSISVSDGSSTSTITADKIVYNKNRSTMEATGNVKYERAIGKQVA